MRNFYNIFKKEIKELLTKQTILALVFILVFYGILGNFIVGIKKEEQKPVNLAVLDMDKSQSSENILKALSEKENINMEIVQEADIEKAIDKTKEKEMKVLLVIPDSLEENLKEAKATELGVYSIMKGFSIREISSSGVPVSIINFINNEISKSFIRKAFPNDEPENISNPLRIKEFVVVKDKIAPGNPVMVKSLATSQSIMIPLILTVLIMYAGMMLITSMALEKENKTLETLLTLPVKRTFIVIGKMVGAAVVAFLMAGVFMLGFGYFMSSMTPDIADSGTVLKNLGLVMNPLSYLLLGISLFLAILSALAIAMIMGMFVQDTKSAQSLAMPMVFLVMVPYFVLLFQDINAVSLPLKIFLYIIPFSHPIIASNALVFQDYPIVIGGIIYMIIFATVMIYIAVRLFNTDKVLTARFSIKKLKRR